MENDVRNVIGTCTVMEVWLPDDDVEPNVGCDDGLHFTGTIVG